MRYYFPTLPSIRQAEAITIEMPAITRPYRATHMTVDGSETTAIDAGAITLIDADALQAAGDAVRAYLDRYAQEQYALQATAYDESYDQRNDYARTLPALTEDAWTDCPECEGTGVFLIGTRAPDDLIEMRCELCLGTGIIDVVDAPTVEMAAMRLNWPSLPTWDQPVDRWAVNR